MSSGARRSPYCTQACACTRSKATISVRPCASPKANARSLTPARMSSFGWVGIRAPSDAQAVSDPVRRAIAIRHADGIVAARRLNIRPAVRRRGVRASPPWPRQRCRGLRPSIDVFGQIDRNSGKVGHDSRCGRRQQRRVAHRVFWKDRRWSEQSRRGGVARTGRISGATPPLRLLL